jgi:hypothetical protein
MQISVCRNEPSGVFTIRTLQTYRVSLDMALAGRSFPSASAGLQVARGQFGSFAAGSSQNGFMLLLMHSHPHSANAWALKAKTKTSANTAAGSRMDASPGNLLA